MHIKQWRVDVFVSEEGDVTKARAVLVGDSATGLTGGGTAWRNPRDPAVPEIGDEVAAGRALAALSRQVLDAAARDIERSAPEDFGGRRRG